MSCTRTFYNVDAVDRPNCASDSDSLTLRIVNDGSIGITNIQIECLNESVDLGGIGPGQKSCEYPMPAFYSRPARSVFILNSKGESQRIRTLTIDHLGDALFTKGRFTLTIKVSKDTLYHVDMFEIR